MTETNLVSYLLECGVSDDNAILLAKECFQQEPPKALIPPEILMLNYDFGIEECINYADILDAFFESEAAENNHLSQDCESISRVIECPMCGEHTEVESNSEAGMFIFAHQVLHQFELNFSLIESWDKGDVKGAGD